MEHEEKKLNAVHERDLDTLLQKLGVLEKFKNGKTHCKFCGSIVGKDNIYSFFLDSGNVSFICDKPECVSQSISYIEEKKRTKLEQ